MKALILIASLFLSSSSFAGIMDVMKEGGTFGLNGGEVRYFKLETDLGQPHLFLLNDKNQGCRIPVTQLKELGIDPIQFAISLRNIRGNDGMVLTCHMSEEQFNTKLRATSIVVVSWPRP